jgi:hypothetical protein
MRGVCLAVILASSTAAIADVSTPELATLDRGDDGTRFELAATLVDAYVSAMRVDAYGQYVDPDVHLGGYVAAPFIHARSDIPGITLTGVGDVEFGGLYVAHTATDWRAVVRAGLVLPTATFDNAFSAAAYARLSDFADTAADTTTLRVSVSPLYRSGIIFARVDLGTDIEVPSYNVNGNRKTYLLRFDAAVGIALAHVAFSLESTNLGTVMPGEPSHIFDEAALAVHSRFGIAEPYAALIAPVSYEERTTFHVAVTIGCNVRLR